MERMADMADLTAADLEQMFREMETALAGAEVANSELEFIPLDGPLFQESDDELGKRVDEMEAHYNDMVGMGIEG
jgi:hypothetical protein